MIDRTRGVSRTGGRSSVELTEGKGGTELVSLATVATEDSTFPGSCPKDVTPEA